MKVYRKIYRKILRKVKGFYFSYFTRNFESYNFIRFNSIISNSKFFFDSNNLEQSQLLNILIKVEDICKHKFDILGFGIVNLGSKINWHTDFRVGRCWQMSYWTRIPICYYDGSDIKIPWELNRFHHLVTLGKAYLFTKNEKYTQEFVSQINSWLKDNPYEYGVNWVSPMEVSIRAVNWIWAWNFFKGSQTLSDEFKLEFLKCLYLKGKFIFQNLENIEEIGGVNGNHLISNGTGLVYLGIFFSELKEESKKWLDKGLDILFNELNDQVYSDGVDYEKSISYHRFVLELFVSSLILCKKNKIEIPKYVWDILKKMFEFVMYYTKPDGNALQIGDNDNGRLHKLSIDNNLNDHRYLLSIAAVLFKRKDFKYWSGGFHEDALWLLGLEGKEIYDSIETDSSTLESKAFKDSGFYIMRKDDHYMFISAGDVGMNGFGSHSHCDTLSFELYMKNQTFVIDPGTYIYTGDYKMRNLFRSSKYHNTVVVDDKEINRFLVGKKELFRMYNDAKPKINKWEITENYDFFDAEHYGYQRLKNPVIHRRQIYFDKKEGYWIVKDILTGKGNEDLSAEGPVGELSRREMHKFELYFHFAPMQLKKQSCDKEVLERVKRINNKLIKSDFCISEDLVVEAESLVEANDSKVSSMFIFSLNLNDASLEITDGWVSYGYGSKVNAPVLKYVKRSFCPMEFTTLLLIK